jgi:hypothetical protein|tara:strand:- start:262 stop:381 length:120 start_codon:yes stop_codon:yes gene_type:complete
MLNDVTGRVSKSQLLIAVSSGVDLLPEQVIRMNPPVKDS